jgi:hypothetical protein
LWAEQEHPIAWALVICVEKRFEALVTSEVRLLDGYVSPTSSQGCSEQRQICEGCDLTYSP